MVWTKSMSGEYTVKSGYNLIRSHRDWGLGDSEKKIINSIWKADIHNRHRMFLWRLVRGAMITRDVLSSRIAGIDTVCPLCLNHTESVVHIFWSCDIARSVWLDQWGIRTNSISMGTSYGIVNFILNTSSTLHKDGSLQIRNWGVALMETIWKTRNDLIFGNSQNIALHTILKRINDLSSEIATTATPDRPPLWTDHSVIQPASFRGVQISCDAAIHQTLSMAACVARDHNNHNLSFITRVQMSNSPCEVEAIAVWEAVTWARNNNWVCCVFESDSQVVINAILNGNTAPIWEIKNTVTDINRVACDFPDWSFKKIPRLMNIAAHSIAQTALRIALKHVPPLLC